MAILQTKKQNSGGYNNTNNASSSSTGTAGSMWIATVTAGASDTIPTAPSGWTLIGNQIFTGARQTWLFYRENAAAATISCNVTFGSGQYTDSTIIMKEHSGIATSGSYDKSAKAADSGYVQSHSSGATAATTQADELVVVVGGADAAAPTWGAGSGYGNADSQAGYDSYTSGAYADKTVSATGAQTGVLTTSSYVQGQAIVATFKKATAAAPASAVTDMTLVYGDTEALVYFNDTAANGATSWKVKRSTSAGGTYTTVGTPTVPYFKDTGLTNGTTYYYKVCPTNAGGDGPDNTNQSTTPTARPADHADQWYPYGNAPTGYTQATLRNYMRAVYDSWVSLCFTQSGAQQAGLAGWRVQAPDQTFEGDGSYNATVSEGQGYGAFATVFMGRWSNPKWDIKARMYFDGFFRYYKNFKDTNGLMNWHIHSDGSVAGSGGATDGDQDMAVALVFADRIWGSSGAINYGAEADTLIAAIGTYEYLPSTDASYPHYQMNGDLWGSSTNWMMADYFAPAWLRFFKQKSGSSAWDSRINANYAILTDYFYNNYNYGLVPDNQTRTGTAVSGQSYKFGYNSVRYPWRMGCEYSWFGTQKAYRQLSRLGTDIKSRSSNTAASANAEPALDWSSNGGYTNQTFVGAYGVAATVDSANADFAGKAANYIYNQYATDQSYFGLSLSTLNMIFLAGEMYPPETFLTATDSGTGTDSVSVNFGTTAKTASDSGAGSDALSVLAQLTQSDTGAGVDTLAQILAQIARSDLGTGSDAVSILAQIARSDAGAGIDVATIMAAVTLADAGVGAEAASLMAKIAQADTGAATEVLAMLAKIALNDSGISSLLENYESYATSSVPANIITNNSSTYISGNFVGDGVHEKVLRSDGSGSSWFFNDPNWNAGDFTIEYDVYIPYGNRDIFNFAFWISNPGDSCYGYMFRLQNAGGDGGLYAVWDGGHTNFNEYDPECPDIAGDEWYHVKIVGVNNGGYPVIHVIVTRTSNGTVHYDKTYDFYSDNQGGSFGTDDDGDHYTYDLPSSGTFGQKKDGAGTTHYIDNIRLWNTEKVSYQLNTFSKSISDTASGTDALAVLAQIARSDSGAAADAISLLSSILLTDGVGSNLVENGDMEKSSGWDLPQSGSNNSTDYATDDKDTGTRSMKMHVTGGGVVIEVRSNYTSGYFPTAGIPVIPGQQLTITARRKTANMAGSADTGTGVQYLFSTSGGGSAGEGAVGSYITTNSAWTTLSTSVTVPAGATWLHIELRWYGHNGAATLTGDAWYDNVSVVQTSPNGSEAISLFNKINGNDTGAGSDAIALLVTIAVSESMAGSDAISLLAKVALNDTGTGAEALGALIALALSDTAAGSEALAIALSLTVNDAGTGVDTVIAQKIAILLADSGVGSDAMSLLALITQADSSQSAQDSIAVAVQAFVADSGSASESVALLAQIALSDTAVSADAVNVLAQIALAESGVAVDNLAIKALVTLQDAAVAGEIVQILTNLSLQDTAAGAEALAIVNHFSLTDSMTGTDAVQAFKRVFPYKPGPRPYTRRGSPFTKRNPPYKNYK